MPDLRDIVQQHGGQLYEGGRAAIIPGPGHSRKDRSLSLRLGEGDRVIFYSHARDSCRDVMSYLGIEARHADSRSNKVEWERQKRFREAERRRQEAADRAICATIWDQAGPIEGTAAEAYLWSRGLILEGCPVLRFHPAAPRSKVQVDDGPPPHPAMIALVTDWRGAPRALHLTYIHADGSGQAFGKRSKLMFGPVAGCAVQLSPPRDGRLAVGEGIESAAAYQSMKAVPTWACLSTAGLQGFEIPFGIRSLTVAADNDANDAGLRAATQLAERAARRCDVAIDMPEAAPDDWADVFARGA